MLIQTSGGTLPIWIPILPTVVPLSHQLAIPLVIYSTRVLTMPSRLTMFHKVPSESQSTVVYQPAHTSSGTTSPCHLVVSLHQSQTSLPVPASRKQTTSDGATIPTHQHTTHTVQSMQWVLLPNGQEPTIMVLAQSLQDTLLVVPLPPLLLTPPLPMFQDTPILHLVHQSLCSGLTMPTHNRALPSIHKMHSDLSSTSS